MTTAPPFYILISQSPLSSQPPSAPSASLSHPTIQYYYADDSPLSLLPQTPDEHVLVLDYSPVAPSVGAKSISRNLAVTALKVAEAPGAAADDDSTNDKMYILEATATIGESLDVSQDIQTPQAVVARFKQRNAVLRRALLYPDANADSQRASSPALLPVSPSHTQS